MNEAQCTASLHLLVSTVLVPACGDPASAKSRSRGANLDKNTQVGVSKGIFSFENTRSN